LTLCYNCKISIHLAKECPGVGPICLCCKIVGHEVEDCPRMIAKVERMNMRQENYQETKDMLENNKEKESEKSQTMLLQFKETMNDHKDVSLPEFLKVKQRINTRIGDFDIECVMDEEKQINIMIE
jgi:predicted DNA binding CopG/RHH family protein